MPLKRTPPPSPAPELRVAAAIAGYAPTNTSYIDSINKQQELKSNATVTSKTREDLSNITVRQKKMGCGEGRLNELQEFMNNMREMFESFKSGIESTLHDLQVSAVKIQSQNTDITNSIQFMSEKHDEFLRRIEKLESEKSENKKYISILEDKIESVERRSRSTCIEIRNIPKIKDENKKVLCDYLINVGNILNLQITNMQIKDIYRTSTTKEKDKPIMVDFCSTLMKDNLIQSLKSFNRGKRNEDKLSTDHIKIPGNKKPIFISEALTYKTKKIFYLAREFAKQNNYSFCWTSRGIVYLRKQENDPFIRIMNESDLDELKNRA